MKVKKLFEMESPNYLHGPAEFGHHLAVDGRGKGPERALVAMADGIADYVNAMYEDMPDGDVVAIKSGIGPILSGWQWLLNHETGRLDEGACESWVQHIAQVIGYDLGMREMRKE